MIGQFPAATAAWVDIARSPVHIMTVRRPRRRRPISTRLDDHCKAKGIDTEKANCYRIELSSAEIGQLLDKAAQGKGFTQSTAHHKSRLVPVVVMSPHTHFFTLPPELHFQQFRSPRLTVLRQ